MPLFNSVDGRDSKINKITNLLEIRKVIPRPPTGATVFKTAEQIINDIERLNYNPDVSIGPESLSKTKLLGIYKTLADFYNGTRSDGKQEEAQGLGPTTGCSFSNPGCVEIKEALKKLWSNKNTKKGGKRKRRRRTKKRRSKTTKKRRGRKSTKKKRKRKRKRTRRK